MKSTAVIQNTTALFNRVKLVLTKPKECWDTLHQDNRTPRFLIGSLLLPLLTIGAVCSILGRQLFGIYVRFLDTWRPPLFEELIVQAVQVIFTVGSVFLGALALKSLAPLFGGRSDMNRSFSLLAHSMIPSILSGILGLIPPLAVAFVLFLTCYSIYLLYQGSSKMLDIPENQRITFVGAAISVMILISVVSSFICAFIAPRTPPGSLSI
jgi:hypothetical protein